FVRIFPQNPLSFGAGSLPAADLLGCRAGTCDSGQPSQEFARLVSRTGRPRSRPTGTPRILRRSVRTLHPFRILVGAGLSEDCDWSIGYLFALFFENSLARNALLRLAVKAWRCRLH